MSLDVKSDIASLFETLSKATFLDVLLPRTPDNDLISLLEQQPYDGVSRLPSRRNLFFDENARLAVVARTTLSIEDLKTVLASLEVTIGAHATDAVPDGKGNTASASGKHDLTSHTIRATNGVEIVEGQDRRYLVWKTSLQLPRPRTRLQRPAIYFTAAIAPSREALAESRRIDRSLLPSYEPLPANVLEPLQFDPSLASTPAYLSEDRVTKVAPSAPAIETQVKPIRGASKRAFPTVPALFTRLRCSPGPDVVLVSLHVEISPIIAGNVSVANAKLSVQGADVEAIANPGFPLQMQPRDEVVLLYRLIPHSATEERSPLSIADIGLEATVHLDYGSQSHLNVIWQSQIDLSQTLPKPIYKWSRPLSGQSQAARLSIQSAHRPSSAYGDRASTDVKDGGVTFTFTAPRTTHEDSGFAVDVHCTNNSGRSRRFAIISVQSKKARPKSQQFRTSLAANPNKSIAVPHSVPLDLPQKPDVMELNPDVRVGPLPPGACYETKMEFLALKTGVLDLGVFRIVDLDTRQTVDVREAPDVISLERLESDEGRQSEHGQSVGITAADVERMLKARDAPPVMRILDSKG